MDIRKVGCDYVDCSHVVQDKDSLACSCEKVMKLRVPTEILLASRERLSSVSFLESYYFPRSFYIFLRTAHFDNRHFQSLYLVSSDNLHLLPNVLLTS
jgi:hypothetical protein